VGGGQFSDLALKIEHHEGICCKKLELVAWRVQYMAMENDSSRAIDRAKTIVNGVSAVSAFTVNMMPAYND